MINTDYCRYFSFDNNRVLPPSFKLVSIGHDFRNIIDSCNLAGDIFVIQKRPFCWQRQLCMDINSFGITCIIC